MAALQVEDADGILIDSMRDVALMAAEGSTLYFNERSFAALMAENDASIGQDERAADGLLSEDVEMLILNKGKHSASTSSLADWLEKMRVSHTCINMPPATAPSTPPPELITTSPSSMGYTDDKDEQEVIRQLSGQNVHPRITVTGATEQSEDWKVDTNRSIHLIVRNPDPASPQVEGRPLPVPPPRSETAPPTSLQSPIKLEIKEEVKHLIKKEESPSSVTFSPMVEEISQSIRPVTAIPTTRRSAFRNVPSIVTQASLEEPEQLFRMNL